MSTTAVTPAGNASSSWTVPTAMVSAKPAGPEGQVPTSEPVAVPLDDGHETRRVAHDAVDLVVPAFAVNGETQRHSGTVTTVQVDRRAGNAGNDGTSGAGSRAASAPFQTPTP